MEKDEFTLKNICKQQGVLVAISGGADSTALLHWLVSRGYRCVAAHCNFHLRGAESDADEAFVRTLCHEMNVPCHVAHFDTRQYAAQGGISIEMAARELRYNWFFELLDQLHLPCVAVAHHADDAAETFLLNLVRGTGIRGLSGMKVQQGRVIRPMLRYSREDIELYCRAHKLSYVTDSTNNSDDYLRNRLRHQVVPQLKQMNPSFLATMRTNMQHLEQVSAIFEQQVAAFAKTAVVELGDQTLISVQKLSELPTPEPYLFELLFLRGFRPDTIHRIARCVSERRWGRTFLAPNLRAIVDRSNVIILPRASAQNNATYQIDTNDVELQEPLHLQIRRFDIDKSFALSRENTIAHFDAKKIKFPLSLRRWRNGDTFRPLGMRGNKKLSDFFVDNKLSLAQKENIWVLESAGQIAWVVGLRLDDRFKITPKSTEVLEIKILNR